MQLLPNQVPQATRYRARLSANVSQTKKTMRTKGKISSWNDEKGYGFIEPLGGGKRVFVHINAFSNRSRRPSLNQIVTYALSTDKQGRPCAAKAALAGDRLSQKSKKPSGLLSIASAIVFLLCVAVIVFTTNASPLLLAIYLVASLITFVEYAIDKSAAKSGKWRTSENTLHLLALVGGWPGALIAQQKLRHKSKKQPFRAVFWLTVVANIGVFVWLLTPSGTTAFRSLLAGFA